MSEEDNKQNKELLEAISGMTKAIAELPGQVQKSVQNGMTTVLTEALQQQPKKKEDEDDPDDKIQQLDADDLEKMDRGQFAQHMVGLMTKEVGRILKPLAERIDETQNSAEVDRLKREIVQARSDHSDFDEFKREIHASIKEHPSLSIEEHYQLVKSANPEKVEELEKKAKEEEEAKKKEEEEKKVVRFGGMTPGSGGKTEKTGKMSTKDAAEAAFEETMAEIPAELLG